MNDLTAVQTGDIFFSFDKGSWISKAIRWALREKGEPAEFSHCGILIRQGGIIYAREAVRIHRDTPFRAKYERPRYAWEVYARNDLTREQRRQIYERSGTFSNRIYGYVKILAQALNRLTHTHIFTSICRWKKTPICMYSLAWSYRGIEDRWDGATYEDATPDDGHDHVKKSPCWKRIAYQC